ncbi:MAG: hypothetical protein BWY94_01244 [Actinobacteria bacterium ADurb.BinA094]|nr:MAG: hypothetical protein BWY94_01244 [Actinobacteria bacterium ADurb.BinA094]
MSRGGADCPPVGGRAGVLSHPDAPQEQVDVRRLREPLGGDPREPPPQGHALHEGRRIGAEDPRVHELPTGEPLGIGPALRQNPPPGDGDDVGGGAPDVDQHAGGDVRRHVQGGRHPVRGREIQGVRQSVRHGRELTVDPDDGERRPGEGRTQRPQDPAHALAPGRERVGELRGHRDRGGLVSGEPETVRRSLQDLTQSLGRAPDLEREHDRARLPGGRAPQRDARRLHVHAADVPPHRHVLTLSHLSAST